jgi:beta-glucosidase
VPGTEIAQLYVGYAGSRVDRPVKELKAFARVELEPGQTDRVTFTLSAKRLAYYDIATRDWIVEPITYHVYVGTSSAPEGLLETHFSVLR